MPVLILTLKERFFSNSDHILIELRCYVCPPQTDKTQRSHRYITCRKLEYVFPKEPSPPKAEKPQMADIYEQQLIYVRRYDSGDGPERFQEIAQVMIRNNSLSNARKVRHAGFHLNWLGPYNIRNLHSGRVFTVDRRKTAVHVPAYNVKPTSLHEEANSPIFEDSNH